MARSTRGIDPIVVYVPEMTYGRPGIVIVARRLRGYDAVRAMELVDGVFGPLVRYELRLTVGDLAEVIWCCGIDPLLVVVDPSQAPPAMDRPHRPYVCIERPMRRDPRIYDQSAHVGRGHCRIIRLADGAVMWDANRTDSLTQTPDIGQHPHFPLPAGAIVHPDWSGLPWIERRAIVCSLRFVETPPVACTLEAEFDRGRHRSHPETVVWAASQVHLTGRD
jgi:hypothetical protein